LQKAEPSKKQAKTDEPGPLQTFRSTPGKIVFNQALPFGDGAQIDFNSPLFNFVILRRLGGLMAPGQAATFDSIVITLPHLSPIRASQTYACIDQTPPQGQTFAYPVWHYKITEPGNTGALTEMWINGRGIPVVLQVKLKGQTHLTELTSFHWRGE
jgi:hypothetical protein